MEKTRGNCYRFHWERFHLEIMKFFTVGTINHWNNLLAEMVESPSLEVCKIAIRQGAE